MRLRKASEVVGSMNSEGPLTDSPAFSSSQEASEALAEMKNLPITVGEKVDRDGVCEAMLRVAELAQVVSRTPVGEWDYRFTTNPHWRICVNGGTHDEWQPVKAPPVKRFTVYIEFNGWPAGIIDAAGGRMIKGLETPFIDAVANETVHIIANYEQRR